MENVIIDVPERIEDDIEGFKLDCVDAEKNYTAAKIKLCRDPQSDKPVLFYSQELVRNFRDQHDPFGKRHIIKVFTPSNLTAVADSTLESKFNDTILAFKPQVNDYNPLTDIHSQKMNLFIDEETARFVSDIGINVDGLGEDFAGIESVAANSYLEDLSLDASRLKQELAELDQQYLNIKEVMAEEFVQYIDPKLVSEEVFDKALANEKVPDNYVQTYLVIRERIHQLEGEVGKVSTAVFSETSTHIRLPKLLEDRYVLPKL
ncbi:MAG: hypothetical protein WCY30_04900 [Candidatus Neomarinimicrobiota bacterium]|jgi:hypothetical protein